MARRSCFAVLAFVAVSAIAFGVRGCGTKGSTKFSYSPPIAPFGISFSIDENKNVSVAAGIATPVGTFSIEQGFPQRQDLNYIVFRNRRRGEDQVFKIASDGHVDLHAVGEHNFRVSREGQAFVVDVETISGRIDI